MSAEMRLIFDDPNELLNFLNRLGAAEDQPNDEELAHTEERSDAISADTTTEPNIIAPVRQTLRVNIPEGSPFANQIVASIKASYGDDTDVEFSSNPIPPSHYDPARKLYFYNGEPYGDGAIIWFAIERNTYFHVGFEIDEKYAPNTVPLDISKLNRHEPKILLERDYQAAFELAKTKNEPGIVVICRDGKFYVPCASFYNHNDKKEEYLVSIFNVKSCHSHSKDFWTMLVIQVGNVSDTLTFKFCQGTEIDWHAAVSYIIEESNRDPYEVEQIKLFDDVEDSMIKKEPIKTNPKPKPKPPKSPKGSTTSHRKSSQ